MKSVKAIPEGYHQITPYLTVKGADRVIEFIKAAFGATELSRMNAPEGGKVVHAECRIGDSRLMISEAMGEWGPMPGSIYLYVEDVDATFTRAIEAGAKVVMEPSNQFWGDRHGGVQDVGGNHWWLASRVEDVSPEEVKRRGEEWLKTMKCAES